MPDMQEVFRMATQKVGPDPGALERQNRSQRRRVWKQRAGGYALLAVVVIAGLVIGISTLRGRDARPGASSVVNLTDPEDLPEPTMDLTRVEDRIRDEFLGHPNLDERADVRGVDGIRLFARGQLGFFPRAWFQPAILVGEPGQKLTIALSNRDGAAEQPHTFTVPELGIDVLLPIGDEKGETVEVTFPESDEPILFFCWYHRLNGHVGALTSSG